MASIILDKARGAKAGQTPGQRVRHTFVVNIENGLHARPCALLVKTLKRFSSEVEVEANGEEASGIALGLMALAAGFGADITFTFTGRDAHQALAAVRHLFDTRFAEAYCAPKDPPKPPAPYASDH